MVSSAADCVLAGCARPSSDRRWSYWRHKPKVLVKSGEAGSKTFGRRPNGIGRRPRYSELLFESGRRAVRLHLLAERDHSGHQPLGPHLVDLRLEVLDVVVRE